MIILVGPDGVGKTTVARAVIERHPGPTAYFHFLPPVRGTLAPAPAGNPGPSPPKAEPGGSMLLGWFRLFKNAAWCWVGYLRTVRPALERRCLVVGDRCLYGYLVQPDALRFYGPRWLARCILNLVPAPDLIVNLSAPPDLIHTRKQELSRAQIEQELLAWASLPFHNIRTVDATRSPHAIAAEILGALHQEGSPVDSPGAVAPGSVDA